VGKLNNGSVVALIDELKRVRFTDGGERVESLVAVNGAKVILVQKQALHFVIFWHHGHGPRRPGISPNEGEKISLKRFHPLGRERKLGNCDGLFLADSDPPIFAAPGRTIAAGKPLGFRKDKWS
jgi:hypothetical protein